MAKLTHEVRDPVHQFVRFDDQERGVIDSAPVQRLRQIHQLATTYLVYPGATIAGSSIRSVSWNFQAVYSM